MLEINELIRNRRKDLGLSQSQLAHEARVSLPTIQNVEAGKANLSQSTLGKIFEVLGLQLSIVSEDPRWEEGIALGVPLTGTIEGTFKSSKDFIRSLDDFLRSLPQKKESMLKETRNWEAFTGFLWALETHYPRTLQKLSYAKKARFLLAQNLKIFEPGRLIKLRRIALSNIGGRL
jgi:transcriptional regulator with XRE-family HTH domain